MRYSISYLISLFIALSLLAGCQTSHSPQSSSLTLHKTSFNQLPELLKAEEKLIVVFLHAPWCAFCENMKQTTFRSASVINELNSNYYFISFDGEGKEDVVFKNNTYQYIPTGRDNGTHELALELGSEDGRLVYPTTVIINTNYEVVFRNISFMSHDELLAVLNAQ